MNQIKLQDITPDIYYNQSRDFQFIGRLFDAMLNSVKTNTETLYSLPISDNSNEQLIDLVAMTLGFKSKHNYNIKQLTALCSTFAYIIKNKGNITAVTTAVKTLLGAEEIELSNTEQELYSIDGCTINLFIPEGLSDINLLKDLLTYILPAGMSCNIIRAFTKKETSTTEFTFNSKVTCIDAAMDMNNTSIIARPDTILAAANAANLAGFMANSNLRRPELAVVKQTKTRRRK